MQIGDGFETQKMQVDLKCARNVSLNKIGREQRTGGSEVCKNGSGFELVETAGKSELCVKMQAELILQKCKWV